MSGVPGVSDTKIEKKTNVCKKNFIFTTNPAIQPYLHALTHLKRAPTRYGIAPHKPVLVLTLLELIAKGNVVNNRFDANAELVGTFQENWQLLVTTPHQADFTQPFYHLQNDRANGEPFKSVHTLAGVLDYGTLQPELFALLQDSINCAVLQTALLDVYFPEHKAYFLAAKHSGEGYLHDVEAYILQEPEAKQKTIRIDTEEEVFVRNGLFKRYIVQTYRHTCAFTGMRLVSVPEFSYGISSRCYPNFDEFSTHCV